MIYPENSTSFALSSLFVFSPQSLDLFPSYTPANLTYNSTISILTITANILKLFSATPTKTDTIMIYQFAVCTVLQILLMNLIYQKHMQTRKLNIPVSSILMRTKHSPKLLITGMFGFIILVRILDEMRYSFLFMKAVVCICRFLIKFII